MDIKHIFKHHASQNIPLIYEEAYELGIYTLEGCDGNKLAQIQSIAALSALHTKATYEWQQRTRDARAHGHGLPSSASEQIAGICAAIFEKGVRCFLEPKVPYAIDNCGMGGDLVVTANVSTIAGFIAAAAGIPICKHGSPANADSGRHGSSDFIALCGINEFAAKSGIERCVEMTNFGYTEALDTTYKTIHTQTHEVARLPHMNDIIGPITNPLHPRLHTRKVLGINHLIPPMVVARAYQILNQRGVTKLEHGLFVRGLVSEDSEEGMDEVSICEGGTIVAELKGDELREYRLFARDFGVSTASQTQISPPKGMSKGEFSTKLLFGEIKGPAVDMILANAALLFYLTGRSENLKECFSIAADVYGQGLALAKMLEVRNMLPR